MMDTGLEPNAKKLDFSIRQLLPILRTSKQYMIARICDNGPPLGLELPCNLKECDIPPPMRPSHAVAEPRGGLGG